MSSNRYRVENQDYDFEEVPADGKAFEDFVETNRRGIEPWLSAIFQSEHLALLAGSGLTTGLTRTVGVAAVEMENDPSLLKLTPRSTDQPRNWHDGWDGVPPTSKIKFAPVFPCWRALKFLVMPVQNPCV